MEKLFRTEPISDFRKRERLLQVDVELGEVPTAELLKIQRELTFGLGIDMVGSRSKINDGIQETHYIGLAKATAELGSRGRIRLN